MFAGYNRLSEGCDHDLKKEYKAAIRKYTEGVEVILNELEKDKEKATEKLLCKIDKYIERIKILKNYLINQNDGNPHAMLLPQQPTTVPIVKKTEEKQVAI